MEGSEALVERLAATLGDTLLGVDRDRLGQPVFVVERGSVRQLCRLLRDDDGGFVHLSSLTGVDYSAMGMEPRYAVVYHLYSPSRRQRVTVKVPLDESDPVVPTIVDIWPGANFHERETFDMFGIRFDGHPNLTRILMPDDADFYPLRKDVPLGGEEVQFSHNSLARPSGGNGQK